MAEAKSRREFTPRPRTRSKTELPANGDDHAPEVFYEFKVRNDSGIAVPFVLQFIKFSDLPLNT